MNQLGDASTEPERRSPSLFVTINNSSEIERISLAVNLPVQANFLRCARTEK